MEFHDCIECEDYKYIQRNGKCPSCLETDSTVTVRIHRVETPFVTDPECRAAITDFIENNPRVELTTYVSRNEDIDIDTDRVYLYPSDVSFEYSEYSGSRCDKLEAALDDAVETAIERHAH